MLARFGGFLDDRGMRKATPLIVLLVLFLLPTTAVGAVPKAGAVCFKNNLIKNDGQFKYTCTKSGSKLIWKKSPKIVTVKPSSFTNFSRTYSTDDGYHTLFEGGPCQIDSTLPTKLKQLETYFYEFTRCAGQLQIAKYSLGNKRPTGAYDSAAKYSSLDPCKITNIFPGHTSLSYIGPNSSQMERRFPSSKTVIQLIPIYSADTEQPVNSPKTDYGFILDFFKEWIDYSSDFGSSVSVRYPDAYIKMVGPIADYGLQHDTNWNQPGKLRFNQDLVVAADPIIDFTGANIAIIVPPPGTEARVIGQAGIKQLSTSEGFVPNVMTENGVLAKNPSASKYSNLGHPYWWIHELMHAGIGFGDRYGDGKRDLNTDYGMGWLTLMTPWGGDFTTWEKWIMGFMQDSQIQCKTDAEKSTHWIAPSTVQTKESKSLIIPISPTKVIVIETLRPGGLYYKLPTKSQGAMVYEIDLTQTKNGYGMKLSLPKNRTVESFPFFMASAPLKVGESTITNGFQITVKESGTFGDLITVEKVQ
jgi:hypothetical protein